MWQGGCNNVSFVRLKFPRSLVACNTKAPQEYVALLAVCMGGGEGELRKKEEEFARGGRQRRMDCVIRDLIENYWRDV